MSMDDDEAPATHLSVSQETILQACGDPPLPAMGIIEQVWERDPIPPRGISEQAAQAVSNLSFATVPEGGTVALGVGSRGIANLPEIVSGVVSAIAEAGYDPFVFPAMGSHGGATGAGQKEMLNDLGVTESAIGCEIRSARRRGLLGDHVHRRPVLGTITGVTRWGALSSHPISEQRSKLTADSKIY